ncbi:hypothetical protein [Pseudobutyrivibrio xylanivorans]|uniref:Uncharacterized protein n=1 Tax=Pseudobutyrivibrio xylanivorans DSM 14809 TaxID=1123012 RepID=A0A1M6IF70_PSEXY|nr:hypothetical protein [Pseudobutyrivibrio xylanivorans]SHJ33043.1 hypothetical protein SAMN02745725_02298 [Pseudobutyrivibrio xylanivorans DSM 14809]
MGATEGTHAGGEFLLLPMGDGLREHGKLGTAVDKKGNKDERIS